MSSALVARMSLQLTRRPGEEAAQWQSQPTTNRSSQTFSVTASCQHSAWSLVISPLERQGAVIIIMSKGDKSLVIGLWSWSLVLGPWSWSLVLGPWSLVIGNESSGRAVIIMGKGDCGGAPSFSPSFRPRAHYSHTRQCPLLPIVTFRVPEKSK